MTDSTDYPAEDLKRVPGLFRRWELPDLLEPDRRYHLEDAGTHADGTPLLAVYADDATQSFAVPPESDNDDRDAEFPTFAPPAPGTEQFISQRELARRWDISPRTLERWRRLGHGPTYLKLRFRVVYNLRHIQAFEADHLHVVRRNTAVCSSRGEQS